MRGPAKSKPVKGGGIFAIEGAAHALAVSAAFRQDILARLAGHAGQSHGQRILSVERNSEIGVQSEQGVRYTGEEFRKAERLSSESGEGSVRDDPVGMVTEDILLCWREGFLSVQAGREVVCVDAPDREGAEEGTAAFQVAGGGCGGEEGDVDEIGHKERPKEGDGAGEEEGG